MDVGNTVIYNLENPKMFVNFNNVPISILRIQINFSEESTSFTRLSKGSMTQNILRTSNVSTNKTFPHSNYYNYKVNCVCSVTFRFLLSGSHVCSADAKGSATSSQGIRGYISLTATLNVRVMKPTCCTTFFSLLGHYTSTCFGLASSPSTGGSNVCMWQLVRVARLSRL
jgi:hypothetical protein